MPFPGGDWMAIWSSVVSRSKSVVAGRGLIQIVVRVRSASDACRRHGRRRRRGVGQRAVRDGDASGIHIVRKVLARVADDAEPVGGGIEVDPERRAHQRNRQGVDELCLGCRRVDGIHAAAVADTVQLPVLHAEVDADESGVVAHQALHIPEVPGSLRCVRPESHQPAVIGQADDPQVLGPIEEALPVIGMDDGPGAKQEDQSCGSRCDAASHRESGRLRM